MSGADRVVRMDHDAWPTSFGRPRCSGVLLLKWLARSLQTVEEGVR